MEYSLLDQWQTLLLLFFHSLALFFFVVLPIILPLPYFKEPWFGVGDLWKMIDPLFTLPLFYFLFFQSKSLKYDQDVNETNQMAESQEMIIEEQTTKPIEWKQIFRISKSTLYTLIFLWGLAFYLLGHGIHTTITFVKDPIKNLVDQNSNLLQQPPYDFLYEYAYNYLRRDWEHLYSHYIYVIGALVMTSMTMFVHRHDQYPELKGWKQWAFFILGSIFYALLFGGTAINFPYGLTVGLVWIFVYGGAVSLWLYKQRDVKQPDQKWFHLISKQSFLFSKGKRLVLQFYLLSYLISLVIILIWIAVEGYHDRASAGVGL